MRRKKRILTAENLRSLEFADEFIDFMSFKYRNEQNNHSKKGLWNHRIQVQRIITALADYLEKGWNASPLFCIEIALIKAEEAAERADRHIAVKYIEEARESLHALLEKKSRNSN